MIEATKLIAAGGRQGSTSPVLPPAPPGMDSTSQSLKIVVSVTVRVALRSHSRTDESRIRCRPFAVRNSLSGARSGCPVPTLDGVDGVVLGPSGNRVCPSVTVEAGAVELTMAWCWRHTARLPLGRRPRAHPASRPWKCSVPPVMES